MLCERITCKYIIAFSVDGTLNLPFSIGRKDCKITPLDTGLPAGNTTNTIPFLKNEFGLTTREAVALIGK